MAKQKKTKKPAKAKKAAKPAKKKVVAKKKTVTKKVTKKAVVKKKAPKVKPKKVVKKAAVVKKQPEPVALPKKIGPLFPIKKRPIVKEKEKPKSKAPVKLSERFLEQQKRKLLELRDHLLDQMQGVAQGNLRSQPQEGAGSAFGMHQADAGSDAYEKDFALSLLSQEQDALYEIEEAIKRIENGSYGICEMSGEGIPSARLEAIPFARYTVECQSKFEKENRSQKKWETTPQFMDSTENFFEEEEGETEEEDKSKAKE